MTETFTLEAENYRPKDIVKYRHLSPSENAALETGMHKNCFLDVYIYTYTYIHTYIHIYIYIYIDR